MLFNDIKHVVRQFQFDGKYIQAKELTSGNVNGTYLLTFEGENGKQNRYILQRINTVAFHDPIALMENERLISEHIAQKLAALGEDTDRRLLEFIPTKDGAYIYNDRKDYWRSYIYVDNVTAYDRIEDPKYFYEAGRGFGEFQKELSDFPVSKLAETIPNFHNTKRRFYAFVNSIAEDKVGRVKEIENEIDFFFDQRKLMNQIVDLMEKGVLPVRVTHNDTKLNNVLIDDTTGKAMCIIDLDTVMPGTVLYDFGDAIRFGASTAPEDERDLSKIGIDMDLFERFTDGFLEQVSDSLTKEEIGNLPLGVKVITCELAMRFLKDYIDGDEYFKVNYPTHNLDRARAQIQLFKKIDEVYPQMCSYIESKMKA